MLLCKELKIFQFPNIGYSYVIGNLAIPWCTTVHSVDTYWIIMVALLTLVNIMFMKCYNYITVLKNCMGMHLLRSDKMKFITEIGLLLGLL